MQLELHVKNINLDMEYICTGRRANGLFFTAQILFTNNVFKRVRFDIPTPYDREGWAFLAGVEAQIQEIEKRIEKGAKVI